MTEHPNLAAALVAALADLSVVEKNRTANAGSYSYDYADLGDIVNATRGKLAEHGIVALTPLGAHGNDLSVTVILLHAGGERMDLGPFPFPHGRDAQATGSMVTYHRRYALMAALGMATGEDDDGAAAVARQPQQQVDGPIPERTANQLVEKCESLGLDPSQVVDRGTSGRTDDPALVLRSEVSAVKQAIEDLSATREEVPA